MRLRKASPHLKERVRILRRESTHAEAILWQHLRNRNLMGLKFRRQHPIDSYIVDFYCPDYGLVIEIDGSQHDQSDERSYDEQRTAYLQGRGLKVLRFKNQDILGRTSEVLESIRRAVAPSP